MFGENPQCRVPEVQALATKFTLYMGLVTGLLSAASSPKMGALSDRYGRKYLMCISVFGGLLSEIVTILAASYPDTIHYTWLLLGSFFDGIFGSFITGMALTHSYAADCIAPSKRAVAFGYFHACLYGGIALGPFIAAYFVKGSGNLLNVFWLAFACHAVFVLYLLSLVPESLSKKKQLAARERDNAENGPSDDRSIFHALKVANFLAPLKILYPTGPGSSSQVRANLLLLSTVNTIIFGVAMGSGTVIIFYANYAFNWGDFETQIFVGTANACRVAALIVFLPLLNYIFRTRYKNKIRRESGIILEIRNSGSDNLDLYTIRAALAFEIVSYAGYAAAKVGPMFFASGLFAAFGGVALPILQSALTKHVPHDRVGQLLGALGLLNALARVVCPTIFSLLYASTVSTFPQTVFLVLCGSFVIAFVVSWFVKPHSTALPPPPHS
jgi:MFS family permease